MPSGHVDSRIDSRAGPLVHLLDPALGQPAMWVTKFLIFQGGVLDLFLFLLTVHPLMVS